MKKKGRYKNWWNIKWGVGHPNKDGAKSSKDRYDNNIGDGNGAKDEYNNDMGDGTGEKMDLILKWEMEMEQKMDIKMI